MPYSYLLTCIPIFLLTDLFLYKPTMLIEVLGQIGFRSSLVFGRSVFSQIMGQLSYGVASASEIGFFSYIYGKLEKDQYQRLTSWTRAGTMAGRSFGYVASQIIILLQLGSYRTLNEIAFIMPCIVLVFALFMPRVHWKNLANRMAEAKGKFDTSSLNLTLFSRKASSAQRSQSSKDVSELFAQAYPDSAS
jgi:thiamine transporter 2/3